MAIAVDLAKMCVQRPSLIDLSLDILRRFSAGGLAPEVQLTLGLAGESLRFARERAARIADSRRLRRVSESEANETYVRRAARLHNLMREAFHKGQ
jgi:hypothetical protein